MGRGSTEVLYSRSLQHANIFNNAADQTVQTEQMANVKNNIELTVILTEAEGSEGNQDLLPEQSDTGGAAGLTDQPDGSSKACLAVDSGTETPMLTISPVRKTSITADNAGRSRSPMTRQHYRNLHNVS